MAISFKNSKAIEVVKKNLLSILSGVVAIAAVAATFWPIGGMFGNLQTASDARGAVYSALEGILTKPRQLPLTDPAKTQQDDLKGFPNQKTIDLGNSVTKHVSDQSTAMVSLIVKLNQDPHAPLVPTALPVPQSNIDLFRFGDLYKLVLSMDPAETKATDTHLQAANLQNLRNDVLQGGIPPTDTEITQAKTDLKTNVYDPRVQYTIAAGGSATAVNQEEITREYNDAAALLPDQMRYEVARKSKMYVANDVFAQNPAVIGTQLPNPVDIWYSQMVLWIQQDVARALAAANANAQNVLDAPVKHLIKLTIPSSSSGSTGAFGPGIYTLATAQNAGGATALPPAPVEGADAVALVPVPAVSPTGRVSNPLYDVVQFTLVINVDSSQVPAVLASLSHNQLMDVMFLTVTSVDSGDQQRQGFFYGSAPIVQLTLSCEALFMRQWTAPLMPDVVKRQIGIAIPGQPGAPPQ